MLTTNARSMSVKQRLHIAVPIKVGVAEFLHLFWWNQKTAAVR
jgi:hypothetical protein